MTKTRLPLITNSSASTYRRCPKLYFYKYVEGYRSTKTAGALFFGSLFHTALEDWWNGIDIEAILTRLSGMEDVDPYDRVKAIELMRGYHHRWIGQELKTVHVERQFRIPITNPVTSHNSRTYEHGGKIDVEVDDDGVRKIVEHKTTAMDISPGSVYWHSLQMDTQISTYLRAADAKACVYDVIRKPAIRILRATPEEKRKYKADGVLYKTQREVDETPEQHQLRLREEIAANPEKYFQRAEIVRLEEEELDAQHDLWQVGKLIRDSELATRWPRYPHSCFNWNRECDFFKVCTRAETLDNEIEFMRVDSVHSELEDEDVAAE